MHVAHMAVDCCRAFSLQCHLSGPFRHADIGQPALEPSQQHTHVWDSLRPAGCMPYVFVHMHLMLKVACMLALSSTVKQSAAPKQVCQYKFSLFALRLFGLLILLVTKSLHVDMGFEGFLWKTFVIKEN